MLHAELFTDKCTSLNNRCTHQRMSQLPVIIQLCFNLSSKIHCLWLMNRSVASEYTHREKVVLYVLEDEVTLSMLKVRTPTDLQSMSCFLSGLVQIIHMAKNFPCCIHILHYQSSAKYNNNTLNSNCSIWTTYK